VTVTIWHNPACGTSRNTLGLIRNSGEEPRVVEYLQTPPDREELAAAISAAGLSVRGALRRKGTPHDALGLNDPALSDAALLDAMLAHPVLINRPFVFTDRGVRLCRPSELVLEILSKPQQRAFTKEDGEAVVDATGRRAAPAGRQAGSRSGSGSMSAAQGTVPAVAARPAMGIFERFLTVWVLLCIAAGIGLGQLAPGAFHAIGAATVAQVNLPVAALIWLMIVPMLLKIDLGSLRQVSGHWRGILATVGVNWLVKPFSMALLGWLFIGWLFRP